jgi:hypothetical protein
VDSISGEKPSRMAWLDKPFTLWVLSTLVISIAGALFAERQQCHDQAQNTLTKVFPLLDEITARIGTLREKLQKSPDQNDPEIAKLIQGKTAFQPAYKDQSLFVILSSYNQVAGRIAASLLPDLPEPPPPRPPAPPVPPSSKMPKTGGIDLKLYLETADVSSFPVLPSKEAVEHDYRLVIQRRVALERANVVETCSYWRAAKTLVLGYSGEALIRLR